MNNVEFIRALTMEYNLQCDKKEKEMKMMFLLMGQIQMNMLPEMVKNILITTVK